MLPTISVVELLTEGQHAVCGYTTTFRCILPPADHGSQVGERPAGPGTRKDE
jgi:hypothetical protein